jgi:hypothetical protein
MNHLASKLIRLVGGFAVSCGLAAAVAHAANDGLSPAAKKMEQRQARRELSALKKYDANGNGVLDAPEAAAKKSEAKAKRDAAVVKKYDADGNGVLDADELAKQAADAKAKHDAAVLKKYDVNHNGVLDPDELASRQANEQRMQILRDAKNKKSAAPVPAAAAGTAARPGENM